jgi:hypothetical protein
VHTGVCTLLVLVGDGNDTFGQAQRLKSLPSGLVMRVLDGAPKGLWDTRRGGCDSALCRWENVDGARVRAPNRDSGVVREA